MIRQGHNLKVLGSNPIPATNASLASEATRAAVRARHGNRVGDEGPLRSPRIEALAAQRPCTFVTFARDHAGVALSDNGDPQRFK